MRNLTTISFGLCERVVRSSNTHFLKSSAGIYTAAYVLDLWVHVWLTSASEPVGFCDPKGLHAGVQGCRLHIQ